MNNYFLKNTRLFEGLSEEEIEKVLQCLQAYSKKYKKGSYIYRPGIKVESLGLLLSGCVRIEQNDIWGDQTILQNVFEGEVFAEAYACAAGERLTVDVLAAQDTEILFLNIEKVMRTCRMACEFHSSIIKNLLSVMADKNLNLTRKISHITPKSIRGRILSYLSFQAVRQNTHSFLIPFNRQELADYLCVDRSALSNELGKMQKEGILTFQKNKFILTEETVFYTNNS